jgi:hypothetical protein
VQLDVNALPSAFRRSDGSENPELDCHETKVVQVRGPFSNRNHARRVGVAAARKQKWCPGEDYEDRLSEH